MIKSELARWVEGLVYSVFQVVPESIVIEYPKNPDHGHFATTVAFGLAKALRQAPVAIANRLAEAAPERPEWSGIRVTPLNGFINFRLSDSLLWEWSSQPVFSLIPLVTDPKRILLEYVSANPTGPLHIGHGRWAVIGSCLASLLRAVGHEVSTEFYVNDAGVQIRNFRNSVGAVAAGLPVPDDGYHGSYIRDLVGAADPVDAMQAQQRDTLARIGTQFDRWFSEQTLHSGAVESGIRRLRELGVIDDRDGAVWFRSTEFGDDKDRVLIKQDGTYTYFAVDIAYHADKLDRGYDQFINIWGADHHGYVSRVRAATQALGGLQWADPTRFTIIIGQLVSLLKGGEPVRMSKRTGEMVTLDEIVDEIGPDAVRFYLAMKSPDTPIEFDLDVAAAQSAENPVYYVQYAHARICAVFRKLALDPPTHAELSELNDSERQVLLACLQYHDEVLGAARAMAPNRLVGFLIELARAVHGMYEASPILKATPALQSQRLFVLDRARQCLQAGLSLLHISAPQHM